MFYKIIQSLDLKRVMQDHNIEFNNHNKCRCFIHTEKTPSMSIKNNRFKCFGCGVSGDVVDFIQMYFNMDKQQAGLYLDQRYNLNADDNTELCEFDKLRWQIRMLTKKLNELEDEGKKGVLYNKIAINDNDLDMIDVELIRKEYLKNLKFLNIAKAKLNSGQFDYDIIDMYKKMPIVVGQ